MVFPYFSLARAKCTHTFNCENRFSAPTFDVASFYASYYYPLAVVVAVVTVVAAAFDSILTNTHA